MAALAPQCARGPRRAGRAEVVVSAQVRSSVRSTRSVGSSRIVAVVGALVGVLLIGACCSAGEARKPQEIPPPISHEVSTDRPAPVAPDAPDGTDGPDAFDPLPSTFDCAAPPPLRPCCRALLPKCTQCSERNRAIDEAYRAQCGKAP